MIGYHLKAKYLQRLYCGISVRNLTGLERVLHLSNCKLTGASRNVSVTQIILLICIQPIDTPLQSTPVTATTKPRHACSR